MKRKHFTQKVSYRTKDVVRRYSNIACILRQVSNEAFDDLIASLFPGTEEETTFFDQLSVIANDLLEMVEEYINANDIESDTDAPISGKEGDNYYE